MNDDRYTCTVCGKKFVVPSLAESCRHGMPKVKDATTTKQTRTSKHHPPK